MIQFGALHGLMAGAVGDMLPVNIAVLLGDDAKRLARAAGLKRPGDVSDNGPAPKSFEGLMNSPWKVTLTRILHLFLPAHCSHKSPVPAIGHAVKD